VACRPVSGPAHEPAGRPRRRARLPLLAVLLLAGLFPPPLDAQASAHRITIDNDFLAYWLPVSRRTDRDYTHGSEVVVQPSAPLLWMPAIGGPAPPCDDLLQVGTFCRRTRLAVAQRIYTPTVSDPRPGERPYAGILSVSVITDIGSETDLRTSTLELATSGPPSLADYVHTALHEAIGMVTPQGWNGQIGFEPAFRLGYSRQRVLWDAALHSVPIAFVTPSYGVSVGTVRTSAQVGLDARVGYDAPHPWSGHSSSGSTLSGYAIAELRQELVIHDLTLDGGILRAGPHVQRIPVVAEGTLGFGFRIRAYAVEYRGRIRGREYVGQRANHSSGSVTLSIIGRPSSKEAKMVSGKRTIR
jgi:lipid A 3-O-deacylase